jgi:hypothetical protein
MDSHRSRTLPNTTAPAPAEPDRGARSAFNRGVHGARELLAEAASGRPLAGLGVSTFGSPPTSAMPATCRLRKR